MLGCVVVGMGVSLVPESVRSTFPESGRLSVHRLPPGQDRAQTVLLWRRGARSPKIAALADVLAAHGNAASLHEAVRARDRGRGDRLAGETRP